MLGPRRLSTWANCRNLVRGPTQTVHRGEPLVGGQSRRQPSSSGYVVRASEKLRLRLRRGSPAIIRELVSSVVQDSRLLLRMPGPHDRRKRVSNCGTEKQQVGAALSADRTRPARVGVSLAEL